MAFLLSSFLQIPPIALGFDIDQPDHLPWQLQHTWQEVSDRQKVLVPGIVLLTSRPSICFGWVSIADNRVTYVLCSYCTILLEYLRYFWLLRKAKQPHRFHIRFHLKPRLSPIHNNHTIHYTRRSYSLIGGSAAVCSPQAYAIASIYICDPLNPG